MLPSSVHYDPHFTLLRRDVRFSSQHAILVLRHTKSRQSRSILPHIQVTVLSQSPLCPVQVTRALFQAWLLPPHLSLFSYDQRVAPKILTQVQARQAWLPVALN